MRGSCWRARRGGSDMKDQGAATPNTAARWPACQASPRQSMSTNTLRMVGPPYDEDVGGATRFHQPFGMRDSRTGMKDSHHERTP
jgi:hypothetical protein